MLKYETISVGELQTNCYLVWTENKEALIIDPGDEGTEIAQRIDHLGLQPMAILLTHGHFDHVLGALDLKLIFNIPLYCHGSDKFLLERQQQTAKYFLSTKDIPPNINIDVDLKNIEEIEVGDEKLSVITLPGHTPGGVGFYSQKMGWLFDGDTLFDQGFWGNISHQYSLKNDMEKSVNKILNFPKGTLVLPGHGEGFII